MRSVALCFAVLAAGCSFAPDSESGVLEPTPPRAAPPPVIPDEHEFAPPGDLKAGQWVRAKVVRGTSESEVTVGVAAVDGERAWIEVVEEGEPRRASLRLVTPTGQIERALWQELPDGPIVVQPVTQRGEAEAYKPDPDEVQPSRAEERIGDRAVPVEVETRIYRDLELGREVRETRAWSREVPPVLAGSALGGLVREELSSGTVRVVAFGDSYKPAIAPPR